MGKNIIYFFISLMLFTACGKEMITGGDAIGQEIIFSIGFENVIKTKVSTDDSFKTTFEEGDEIGIFVYLRNEGQEVSIEEDEIYVDNRKIFYDGNSWIFESPIYYTNDGTLLDIYAYYPYENGAKAEALVYNASVSPADLLAASTLGIEKISARAVPLLFKHLLSMVHLSIDKTDRIPNLDDTFNAYFCGVVGGEYNLATSEIIDPVKGVARMIVEAAGVQERVYRTLVPAQEIIGETIFSFYQTSMGNEFSMNQEATELVALLQGHASRFHVTLKSSKEKDPVYEVYDPYPKYGTPVGMVLETYNNGKNGLVISLQDAGTEAWSIENVWVGCADIYDGISNTMKVQALTDWEVNYPAFKMCTSLGEGWYLPSIEEAYPFIRTKVDEVNLKLAAISGSTPIDTWANYFTSTETAWNTVRKIYVQNGDSNPIYKTNHNKIRAFYQF